MVILAKILTRTSRVNSPGGGIFGDAMGCGEKRDRREMDVQLVWAGGNNNIQ